jgi:hypothetical protein
MFISKIEMIKRDFYFTGVIQTSRVPRENNLTLDYFINLLLLFELLEVEKMPDSSVQVRMNESIEKNIFDLFGINSLKSFYKSYEKAIENNEKRLEKARLTVETLTRKWASRGV